MQVVHHIEGVVRNTVLIRRVASVVENAELAVPVLELRLPRPDAVIGNVRKACGLGIQDLRLLRQMEYAVLFAEGNGVLHEGKEGFLAFHQLPVQPPEGVVLAVGVVVAALGISEFIPRHDERRALAQEQQQEGVPELLAAEFSDLPLPGRSLYAAVPAEVSVRSVGIPLSVQFVVLPVVAHHIHHGEAVGIGHIIDDSRAQGVVLGVEHKAVQRAFVPLQVAPHIPLEVLIAGSQKLRPLPGHLLPVLGDDLGPGEVRISGGCLDVGKSHDMQAIHPEEPHIPAQHRRDIGAVLAAVEIKLRVHFDPGGVHRLHQLTEFARRIPVLLPAEAGLRREMMCLHVAPAVDPSVRLPRQSSGSAVIARRYHQFLKLLAGHQIHSRDPQLLQVRDLLDNAVEGPLLHHAAARRLGEVPHIDAVDDGIRKGGTRMMVLSPVEGPQEQRAPELVSVLFDLSPAVPSAVSDAAGILKKALVVPETVLRCFKRFSGKAGFCQLLPGDVQRPDIAQPLRFREGQFQGRLLLISSE